MIPNTSAAADAILSSPAFRELVVARARLRWGLSAVTLLMFFGFIGLTSVMPGALGQGIGGGGVPLGIGLAFLVIVMAVVLTGIYTARSNARFDGLVQRIRTECKR
jgi:uncharacterized membrane protein (DUF485 family)